MTVATTRPSSLKFCLPDIVLDNVRNISRPSEGSATAVCPPRALAEVCLSARNGTVRVYSKVRNSCLEAQRGGLSKAIEVAKVQCEGLQSLHILSEYCLIPA